MKTHTIKTPTAELLIVELEKGARKTAAFIVDVNGYPILDNYTLLGKPNQIKEEDAAQLIPMYFDHEKTAVEYLIQMIESEIYFDNPIPTPEIQGGYDDFGNFHGGYCASWISAFEEAEQKTFDRNRSIILKKNK